MPAALCVYAIVLTGAEPPASIRSAGQRLRLVTAGRIAAVVGHAVRRHRPTEKNLRAYDRGIRALADRFAAVLPARFGTYVDSDQEIEAVLRARHSSLRALLSRVRNRVQMNVRISGGRPLPNLERSPGAGGAAYLRERARRQSVAELEAMRPAVRRWIRDERLEQRGRVASVYHLIPRGSAGAYRAALLRAAARERIRLLVTGPWPAYAFGSTW